MKKTKISRILFYFVIVFSGLTIVAAGTNCKHAKTAKKVKTKLTYNVTGKEYLLMKTEYDKDGKELKSVSFHENGKEYMTIKNEYDSKGLKVKTVCNFTDFEDVKMEYSIFYKYDDKNKLISEKYEGDYASDVSPDFFEYVYDKEDKLVEKLHFVTLDSSNPKDLTYKETFKYDSKGNKIEEVIKGVKFDYLSKKTFEYNEDNLVIKSSSEYDGKVETLIYKYEFYE